MTPNASVIINILQIISTFRRCQKLTKNTMNITKGVCVAVATGAAACYVGNKLMHKNPKQLKKKAGNALHAMGEIVEDISFMLK